MERSRSLRRWLVRIALVYGTIVVAVNAAIFIAVVVARALGHSPDVDEALPDIRNVRRVDSGVYSSGQPDPEHYEALARLGFTTIVDLRAHTRSDPQEDRPAQLAELGLDYVHIPVVDGRAPNAGIIDRALAAIDGATGKVLVHCGGGVGRSGVISAAYLAERGRDPSVMDQLGIGPPSLEQIHYVAATGEGDPYENNEFVNFVSRYVVDGPRRLWHTISGI